MLQALQVLTVILVAIGMAVSLAHALELPGKLRLPKEAYIAVQPIYYPGFTVAGGLGEAGGILATLLLLVLTPAGTAAFWLTFAALLALLAMHAVYWVLTHPVNKFWLRGAHLTRAGASFFSFDPMGRGRAAAGHPHVNWDALRDRWEYSHVARAALALGALVLLAVAVTL